MSTPNEPPVVELERAVIHETEVVLDLASTLRQAREAVERGRPDALELTLARAEGCRVAVERAEAARTHHVAGTVRQSGLSWGSSLFDLAGDLGRPALEAVATDLAHALDTLGRESKCLSLCTRFGAAVTDHLVGLVRPQPVYGPAGLVGVPRSAPVQRA